MSTAEEVTVVTARKLTAKGRFVFDESLSMALLYEVQLCGAHMHASGKKQVQFEKVLDGFVKSREYKAVEKDMPQPTWRTLADRLFKMVVDRRAFVAVMKKKSGEEEVYGEKERMLDAIIEDIQQKKAAEREAKKEKSERADALKAAGEATRAMATRDLTDAGEEYDSPRRKKAKKAMFGADGASHVLAASMERQQNLDEERLKLQRDQLEVSKKQQETLMDLVKMLVAKST